MEIKLRPYKNDLGYSYSIGVYPTLELLNCKLQKVRKVLLSSRSASNLGAEKIKILCSEKGIETEVSNELINRLAGKENCLCAGVFDKYSNEVRKSENHVVLAGVRDMGNLGTICRTMLGFNFHNLAIVRPAADIFDPKVIRASMGAIFHLGFQYFEKFEDYQKLHSNNLYPFMTDGESSLSDISFEKPYSLVFGNEAAGLEQKFHSLGKSVKIPQSGNVDSLNLSVAVGIALYETQKLDRF